MGGAAEIPLAIEEAGDSRAAFDFDAMSAAIEAPDRGWVVARNLFSPEQIEAYRRECLLKFDEGPFFPDKFLVPGETPDYVSPWIYDAASKRHVNHRLYQFFHNPHSAATERIFRTVEHLRDRIEERWPENRAYNRTMGLWPETTVTRYAPGSGRYPRHTDVPGRHTSPLLQCILLLSEPGVHYRAATWSSTAPADSRGESSGTSARESATASSSTGGPTTRSKQPIPSPAVTWDA